jgi:hypothetical protein
MHGFCTYLHWGGPRSSSILPYGPDVIFFKGLVKCFIKSESSRVSYDLNVNKIPQVINVSIRFLPKCQKSVIFSSCLFILAP